MKNDPAPHTVLNIVSALTNEKRLDRLVKAYDGSIREYLQESFGNFLDEIDTHYKLDLNDILKDQITYFIYKLAANRKGTDIVDINYTFGKLGVDKLQYLLEKGLVFEEAGRIHASEKNFSLDVSVAASHLPELVKYYKPHQVGKGQNLFYSMSETINEDGIRKIKEIQKEAIKKIHAIMNSPFYEGDIPFFTLDLCDTLRLGHETVESENTGVLQ
ncbi:hypothetical protein [Bacteriovorax sp. DB6_IX]|uniref:hypothetical protein n=1 Tax=Bacteriovorax sp. DB6_IX TaxID=1353530 RepID=UPI000389E1CC|nr:hypothetical protein [Bacteriovorax sp. DB6_IX]EQC50502.1 hypothetical protein M901_1879 [Bacteriovorax sp. DB6_IX]